MDDLRHEAERAPGWARSGVLATMRFWAQVAGVCAYSLRDRWTTALVGRVRPGNAARMALLGLLRSPGTAFTAVLTLGIGLAATVTLFGVIHGMRRPLPVPRGEEIVRGELSTLQGAPAPITREALEGWRRPAPGLVLAGAFRTFTTILEDGEGFAERRAGAAVTPEVLTLLETEPLVGRLPTEDPADRGATVLGFDLWQERYGGRREILGSSLRVEGRWTVVVGVMPQGFAFPYQQEIWTVLDPREPEALAGAELVGRRSADIDPDVVGARLDVGLAALPGADSEGAPRRAAVRPYVGGRGQSDEMVALAGLGALVTLLLAVCAANVSTLLLVRASERARVMAVHAALGAPRLHLALQLLLESLWITVAGGAVGILAGWGLLSWIEGRMSVHWGYYWMRMELRPQVVLWTAGMILVAAVVAGTIPALMAMRTDLRGVLSSGAGRGVAGGSSTVGRWFVGVQVALSTAGLVAAVFLGAGVARSADVMGALPLDEVVVARVPLADVLPAAEDRRAAVASLTAEMAALGSVSVSTGIPTFGVGGAPLARPGAAAGDDLPTAYWTAVDPAHFEVHGLTLERGRLLGPGDGQAEPVVVVNESFARRFLVGEEPLGAVLRLEGVHDFDRPARVVGVVADHVPDRPGTRGDRAFVPLDGRDASVLWLSARGGRSPAEVAAALRRAVRRVHPGLPLEDVRTLRSLMDFLSRVPRVLGMFGFLGGVAGVLVAAIGLYGVIAFQVRSRFTELGVRLALGAGAGRVLRHVVAAGIRRVLPGLAVGLGLGALVSPLLAAFLFGLSPGLFLVYLGVALGMIGVAATASLGPALRAARLDPVTVLRSE
jgi:predicted permease